MSDPERRSEEEFINAIENSRETIETYSGLDLAGTVRDSVRAYWSTRDSLATTEELHGQEAVDRHLALETALLARQVSGSLGGQQRFRWAWAPIPVALFLLILQSSRSTLASIDPNMIVGTIVCIALLSILTLVARSPMGAWALSPRRFGVAQLALTLTIAVCGAWPVVQAAERIESATLENDSSKTRYVELARKSHLANLEYRERLERLTAAQVALSLDSSSQSSQDKAAFTTLERDMTTWHEGMLRAREAQLEDRRKAELAALEEELREQHRIEIETVKQRERQHQEKLTALEQELNDRRRIEAVAQRLDNLREAEVAAREERMSDKGSMRLSRGFLAEAPSSMSKGVGLMSLSRSALEAASDTLAGTYVSVSPQLYQVQAALQRIGAVPSVGLAIELKRPKPRDNDKIVIRTDQLDSGSIRRPQRAVIDVLVGVDGKVLDAKVHGRGNEQGGEVAYEDFLQQVLAASKKLDYNPAKLEIVVAAWVSQPYSYPLGR